MSDSPRDTLDREMLEDPHSFRFFQAVRLIQRLHRARARVGRFEDPGDEAVRFGANPDLAFPPGEIDDLTVTDDEPWDMRVNFMGLVGHMGVLPRHYSTLVSERNRSRDPALLDFLDLFHHRLVSLFYRAWERYRFYAVWERDEDDPVTAHLLDLLGLGDPGSRDALDLDPGVLLAYVGLLAPRQRSAVALQQILEDYFGVPVDIQQFVGAWYDLSDTVQCRVDDEARGFSSRLGYGALVGDEVWDPNSRVRLVIGPLPLERYRDFLPTGSAHQDLRALVRFFTDDEIEFELQLVLERDDVPGMTLGGEEELPLGWTSWIRSAPLFRNPDDTVLML